MSGEKNTPRSSWYQSRGVGVSFKHKPVSVMLPPALDDYVRSLPNRSEWLRQAIADAVERDLQSQGSGESVQHQQEDCA